MEGYPDAAPPPRAHTPFEPDAPPPPGPDVAPPASTRRGRLDRRTLLLAGGGLLAAGAAGALGMTVWDPYRTPAGIPEGTLAVSTTRVLGHGALHVDLTRGVAISVDGVRLWTSPGAFLAAAHATLEWRDIAGHFTARRTLERTFTNQEVRAAFVVGDAVRLEGTLSGAGGVLQWVASLRALQGRLALDVDVPGADLVMLRGALEAGEGVHGLGEQFAPFDLTGQVVPIVAREQGVGRGLQPLTTLAELTNGAGGSQTATYAPLPSLVTDGLRGFELGHDEVAQADLRAGRIELTTWARTLRLEARSAPDVPALLASRTDRMAALPSWTAKGGILGVQGGTDAVRRKLGVLLDHPHGAPLAGVWVQDWVGRRTTDFGDRLWWHWELDEERYQGFDGLVADLSARGVRMLTYVNPYLVDPAGKPGGVRRDLYAEASGLGYLVKNRRGGPYLVNQGGFDAALVDLTHPHARMWLADVLATQVAPYAPGGWMADFGEGLPFDAVLTDGDPRVLHNRWPTLWAELNQVVRHRVRGERLVFHRSAGRGTARAAGAFWAGDQLSSFDASDGMESALRGLLSGGVSGLTLNHTDVGGYTSVTQPLVDTRRDAAVLRRWAEWSAWTPLFRTHEGNRPDASVQAYDADVADDVAEQLRVFAALASYRSEVVRQASVDGLPAVRHCWIHHRGTRAAARDDQYTFGERFLVAPVFAADAAPRTVTLPPGDWTHVWTGHTYAGDADVTPGHRRLPVFHRTGDAEAAGIAQSVRQAVRS